jgi:hypothetical protein
MKTFNIYKKRDGQDWKFAGEYFLESFEEAKKEFAKNCWNDLLNGKHGDNFTLFTESDKDEFDFVTEDGIYDGTELFFSKSNLESGIEFFSEDVYSWEIRELFKFKITEEDGYTFEEEFESLDKAQDCFSKNEGYKVEQIN